MYGFPDEESSDGSWFPGRDYRPDTPEPKTEQQKKARLREMYVEPKRWGSPTLVTGHNDFNIAVLVKDSYLKSRQPLDI